ncbi:Lysine-specific demethylase 8 [Escovopsis weberi]|uniref:Lysine-specific demethylase 8 n=1 Tax=Escovopsis weberi TaxID=150374 RepID=A0A0M8N134_ESCWE|nr:Lysine-specific demethylase 8 [Escovopsis weberi]
MTLADDILSRYLQAAMLLTGSSDTPSPQAENSATSRRPQGEVSPPDDDPLPSRGLAAQQLLRRQARIVVKLHAAWAAGGDGAVDEALLRTRLDDLAALSMSAFYAHRFDRLPYLWRQVYTDTLILHSHCEILQALGGDGAGAVARGRAGASLLGGRTIDRVVAHLDRALITAGGAGTVLGTPWIEGTLELLDRLWRAHRADPSSREEHQEHQEPRVPAFFSEAEPFGRPRVDGAHECPRRSGWGLGAFEAYMNAGAEGGPRPLVLEGLLAAWPALAERPWRSPVYLLSQTLGGRRLVPVEVGRSYVDAGWAQELMPFQEFLGRYVLSVSPANAGALDRSPDPAPPAPGYLAQHDLFRQIPALRRDVLVPDLCWADVPGHPLDAARDQPPLDAPRLNAWLGPARTITPLHTDGYHNLLCQVVGAKYVRLYPPSVGDRLRPRGPEHGVDMSNTSELDLGLLEGWDPAPEDGDGEGAEGKVEGELERGREALRGVEYWECVLGPGDTLLIPLGWWHYVRSLSTSFSVSFWWN